MRAPSGSLCENLNVCGNSRPHSGGAQNDRLTGNFAAALFTHDTSRALDPHLHTHCIVFNATFDPVENRWKALQYTSCCGRGNLQSTPIITSWRGNFGHFGYGIRNRARGDFEIEGISDELCERFSKRAQTNGYGSGKLLAEKPETCWRTKIRGLHEPLATEERANESRDN